MRCPACGFENASGKCGASLRVKCASCGFENAPGIKFCGECGTKVQGLDGGTQVSSIPSSTPTADTFGERRRLTVLFCDMVDSTRLAAGMDAEDWRELVRGYQEAADGVVERYGGPRGSANRGNPSGSAALP